MKGFSGKGGFKIYSGVKKSFKDYFSSFLMEKGNIKKLEEIAESSDERIFLLDTCALVSPLGAEIRDLNHERIKDKTQVLQKNEYFMKEMRNYLEEGKRFFVTDLVLGELECSGNYSYCKTVKNSNGAVDRRLLFLRKKIKDQEKERKKLTGSLRKNENVLKVSETPERIYYDYLFGRYEGLSRRYLLSDADFDFVLTGAALALAKKNVALISNDYKSMYAWNEIVVEEGIDEKILNFFTRVGFFDFEKKSVRVR